MPATRGSVLGKGRQKLAKTADDRNEEQKDVVSSPPGRQTRGGKNVGGLELEEKAMVPSSGRSVYRKTRSGKIVASPEEPQRQSPPVKRARGTIRGGVPPLAADASPTSKSPIKLPGPSSGGRRVRTLKDFPSEGKEDAPKTVAVAPFVHSPRSSGVGSHSEEVPEVQLKERNIVETAVFSVSQPVGTVAPPTQSAEDQLFDKEAEMIEDLAEESVKQQESVAPTLSVEQGMTERNFNRPVTGPVLVTEIDEYSGPPELELEAGGPQQPLEGDLDQLEEGTVLVMEDETAARLAAMGGRQIHYEQHPPETLSNQQGGSVEDSLIPTDLRTVEFNFLDNKNICCGLCGEIVPYEQLMNEHLPNNHPEILGDGETALDEIPYEEWLREKLRAEKRAIESGFKLTSYEAPARVHRSANRNQRRVSQIRVNPVEMNLQQLDMALKKKMVEKMGRKVPVTLVDKQHARCGLCNAVVSLNKKFEVVHLVRHFNAWHPSTHRCAGTWIHKAPTKQGCKPLSMHDFAVIDSNNATPDNLQCIWCGMFMDTDSLAMHFDEVHPDDIEVPKCNLCLQELVLNARMQEKYGDDFEITLPDEHHIRCGKFNQAFTSEGALERGIERRLAKGVEKGGEEGEFGDEEEDEEEGMDELDEAGPEAFLNSRMALGKRKKPKRQFIMPALRQAAPIDSEFVEPVTECHWKCKMCDDDILAAVISAGAIKHYRNTHPEHLDNMQYELCKARLERVSDGCMEFVHPQLIECLLCNMTYNLHKPFNMCRAIRHLKSKHPNLMPEYAGVNPRSGAQTQKMPGGRRLEGVPEVELRMVDNMDQLKELGIDISKMEAVAGADGEQVYIVMPEGSELDPESASELAAAVSGGREEDVRVITEGDVQEDQPGTRVFTLPVGKQGSLLERKRDNPPSTSQPPEGLKIGGMNRGLAPMPEPLTTD